MKLCDFKTGFENLFTKLEQRKIWGVQRSPPSSQCEWISITGRNQALLCMLCVAAPVGAKATLERPAGACTT